MWLWFVSSLLKFEEMNSELEENRDLAENRLSELQKLQQDLQTVVQENNNMKVNMGSVTPDNACGHRSFSGTK